MPDNTAIIEVLYKTAGVGDVKAGTAAIKESDAAAKSVGGTMRDVGKEHENALGMSRREWMRTGSEVAFYARSALSSLGQVDKGLSQSISLVTQLGESFMFGGVTGVAIAAVSTGIGALIGQIQASEEAARKAREGLVAPFIATRKELEQLAGMEDPLAGIEQSIPAGRKQIEDYARSSKGAAADLLDLSIKQEKLATTSKDLGEAQKRVTAMSVAWAETMRKHDRPEVIALARQQTEAAKTEYDVASHAFLRARAEESELTTQVHDGILAFADQQAAVEALTKANKTASVNDDYYTRQIKMKDDAGKALNATYLTQKDLIEKLLIAEKNLVKGWVGQALTPTTVTPEDMKAAEAGTYKDKPDEFGRRVDAVIAGTDPAKYGAKFQEQFKKALDTGMSPQEISAAFKDKSIFGEHPELVDDLWDFGAMGDVVVKEINKDFGSKLLMDEGIPKIFEKAKNDPVLAAKMKALGIETSDDLKKAFEDKGGLDISPKEAENFIAECQKIRGDVEANIGGDLDINVIWHYTGGSPTDTGDKKNVSNGGVMPGIIPPHATGGDVIRGRAYLVGEQGPEPFVPAQNGRILSNQDARDVFARNVATGAAPAPLIGVANFYNQTDWETNTYRMAQRLAERRNG